MEWLEVTVDVGPQWQEQVIQALLDMGVQGVEVIDPDEFSRIMEKNRYLDYTDDGFIERYGTQVVVKAYFPVTKDIGALQNDLSKAFHQIELDSVPPYRICTRDDAEWKESWKQHYTTFPISERVTVKPSWENPDLPRDRIVIELDPGMAFGTGTHETTRMCAALLDQLMQGHEKVLDLGCGTGILGIIAARLGASEVLCVDIDSAACKTAQENIQNNQVEKIVNVMNGQLKNVPIQPFDIIVVNIIADIILSLLPMLREYCSTQTRILLSGIIRERKQEILGAIRCCGFCPEQEKNNGEWVAIQICIDS